MLVVFAPILPSTSSCAPLAFNAVWTFATRCCAARQARCGIAGGGGGGAESATGTGAGGGGAGAFGSDPQPASPTAARQQTANASVRGFMGYL